MSSRSKTSPPKGNSSGKSDIKKPSSPAKQPVSPPKAKAPEPSKGKAPAPKAPEPPKKGNFDAKSYAKNGVTEE